MTLEATAQALADDPIVDTAETPEVSEDDELSAIWDRDDSEHTEVEPLEDAASEPEQAQQKDDEAEASEEPEEAGEAKVEASEAPSDVPRAVKEHWKDIPEGARDSIVETHRDMSRKLAEQGRLVQGISPIRDVLTDAIKQNPALASMRPQDLARDVMQLSRISAQFNERPLETIMGLVKQHGIEDQFRAALAGQQPTESMNVNTELKREITALKQQLRQVSDPDFVQSQAEQVLNRDRVQSSVNEFASTADHWSEVEAVMPQYIQAVKAISPDASSLDVLKEAYDLAVSRNVPEALKAKQPASEEEPAEADPKKTEAALKAKSVNVRSKPNDRSRKLTEDEELSKVWERNNS